MSYEVELSLPTGEQDPVPPFNIGQLLLDIRHTPNINEQFFRVDNISRQWLRSNLVDDGFRGMANEFIDFAADPKVSPSLLVRAKALDVALELASSDHFSDCEGLMPMRAEFTALLGKDYARKIMLVQLIGVDSKYEGVFGFDPTLFMRGIWDLREHDGLDEDQLFPDWHEYSFDPLEMPNCVPAGALLFLDKLAQIQTMPHLLPTSRLAGLVPLALEIQQHTSYIGNVNSQNEPKLRQDAEQIYELSKLEDAEPYIERLQSLKESAAKLKHVFPEAYGNMLEHSAQSLIAKSSYAIYEHLQNGKRSRASLPLRGDIGRTLPLRLEGDEPLELLFALEDAIDQIHKQFNDENTVVTSVVDEPDFSMYRFWQANGGNNLSLYIRPKGSDDFRRAYEYGNQHGVEASISFVIDPTQSEAVLELGRHAQSGVDNRISIRLDREGRAPADRQNPNLAPDPAQKQGTLSLDIGSVLGKGDELGTRIGRFLAWGDQLRAQAIGEDSHLNHVTEFFGEHNGRADRFAAIAGGMAVELECRRQNSRLLSVLQQAE